MTTVNRMTQKRNTASGTQIQVIKEEEQSNYSEKGNKMSDSDEDENFGRTDEVIDLETVNTGSSTKKPPQKSLLPADYQSDDTPKSMISNKKAAVEESKES